MVEGYPDIDRVNRHCVGQTVLQVLQRDNVPVPDEFEILRKGFCFGQMQNGGELFAKHGTGEMARSLRTQACRVWTTDLKMDRKSFLLHSVVVIVHIFFYIPQDGGPGLILWRILIDYGGLVRLAKCVLSLSARRNAHNSQLLVKPIHSTEWLWIL